MAKFWAEDPRVTDEPPETIELCSPHAPWPKPGYGADLVKALRACAATGRANELTPLVDEATAALDRVYDALE